MSIKYQKTFFLFANFLYNLSRVLPHAILSIILLSKGFSIGQISIIQSFFMIAGILLEIPSGILSDIISEKYIYQISLVFITASYMIVIVSSSFWLMCFSWFLYGVSSAGMTGSLDSYFIKDALDNDQGIKKFNIQNNYSLLLSSLLGGGIGASIYGLIHINIYILSILGFIISFVLIQVTIPFKRVEKIKRISVKELFENIRGLLKDEKTKNLVILISSYQIIAQVFFQYWQFILIQKDISAKYFGLVYVLFQFTALISNWFFSVINVSKRNYIFSIILISVLFISGLLVTNSYLVILLLLIFELPFNLYISQLNMELQNTVGSEGLSTSISVMEFTSTIVATSTLWLIAILVSKNNLFLVLGSVVIIFLVVSLIVIFNRKKIKDIN
ncbi:MFS transporter [Companilactobacillus metriopterae]|uniref:MFS transporter n=1 Tax=Companilactobacillus metriopterae TaxID=1909267 RepID=UPI0013E96E7D|nr:MFS transporter [Companilactobacillus metriopterae]